MATKFRRITLLLMASLPAFAQGTITRTAATVTATSGPLVCKFTHPKNLHVLVSCAVAGTVRRKDDLTPSPASLTGAVGSVGEGNLYVSWIVRQSAPKVFTFEITTNGANSSGTF